MKIRPPRNYYLPSIKSRLTREFRIMCPFLDWWLCWLEIRGLLFCFNTIDCIFMRNVCNIWSSNRNLEMLLPYSKKDDIRKMIKQVLLNSFEMLDISSKNSNVVTLDFFESKDIRKISFQHRYEIFNIFFLREMGHNAFKNYSFSFLIILWFIESDFSQPFTAIFKNLISSSSEFPPPLV